MNNNDTKEINDFNQACLDFMSGRYILADIKINNILRTIQESDLLSGLIARCVNNYNFAEGFKQATGETIGTNGTITLPEKDREKVALIYNILCSIGDEVISFFDFVNNYIKKGNILGNAEFSAFATAIVQPFNEAVNSLLRNEYSEKEIIATTKSLRSLEDAIQNILENIDSYKLNAVDAENLKTMLIALSLACNRNDDQTVFALLIGIEYFCAKHFKCKHIIKVLKDCSRTIED